MKRLGLVFTFLLLATQAFAQHPGELRQGFTFSGGAGYGRATCESCEGISLSGASGGLFFGWNVGGSGAHQIGIGTTGWTRAEDGSRLTLSTLDFRYKTYFTPRSRTFLQVGLGFGGASFEGESASGAGFVLGGGHDIRVGSSGKFAVAPFVNLIGLGLSDDGFTESVGVFQVGLQFTIH